MDDGPYAVRFHYTPDEEGDPGDGRNDGLHGEEVTTKRNNGSAWI